MPSANADDLNFTAAQLQYDSLDAGTPPSADGEIALGCEGCAPSVVVVVDRVYVTKAGGDAITLTGSFPKNMPLVVYFGPEGELGTQPVYGGYGNGYAPVSLDGTTLVLVMPPTAFVGNFDLNMYFESGDYTILRIGTVVERVWPSKLHEVRRSFPPHTAVGAFRREAELPQ